jgi:hypothetical protein
MNKITEYFTRNKTAIYIVLGLVMVLIVGGGVYAWKSLLIENQGKEQNQDILIESDQAQEDTFSKLEVGKITDIVSSANPDRVYRVQRSASPILLDTANWKIYQSDELGIRFRYPDNWDVRFDVRSREDYSVLFIQLPDSISDNSRYLDAFSIQKYNKRSQNDSFGMLEWIYSGTEMDSFTNITEDTYVDVTILDSDLYLYKLINADFMGSNNFYDLFSNPNGEVFSASVGNGHDLYEPFGFSGDRLWAVTPTIVNSIEFLN